MKSLCKSIFAAALAALTIGAAWADEPANMYLIKGERVVGKYAVDDVDYVAFKVPDGVHEDNIWLSVDNVGKNSVTYSVSAVSSTTTYAHGLVSYYDANYLAMDQYGDMIDNLPDEQVQSLLMAILPYSAYLGTGNISVTRTDWEYDGFTNLNVTPGTKYYVCAWEVDPVTQKPYDTFVYTDFTTLDPGDSPATLTVKFKRQNDEGVAYEITGSDDLLYISTAFGERNTMASYTDTYGADFLFGTFGQNWTIADMQGFSAEKPEIEKATWPAWESGEYILMVRGYDVNGDMVTRSSVAQFVGEDPVGPEIKIVTKTKGDGKVSVNFEIAPSNVDEAYVRMMLENDVENSLNDGWELWELAASSKATDITNDINTNGEYTFAAEGLDELWYTIIVYAKDKQGSKTALRINFNTLEGSNWSIYQPVHAPARSAARARMAAKSRRPAFDRVK